MHVKEVNQTATSANLFLSGNFAPVNVENTEFQLTVTGKIPNELEGCLVRIGPNPVSKQNPKSYHWFLGTGMVHGVRLKDGKAKWYKNRYVMTEDAAKAFKKSFLIKPRKSRGGITVNTNILNIAGNLFALVEAGNLPVKINADLDSVEYSDFDGTLKHGFTAHPRKDPLTGELHAITYEVGKKSVDYLVIDKAGRSQTVAQISAPHQPMIHDTAITDSYVIVLDLPVTFNLLKGISGTFPYSWNRAQKPQIGLLPRDGDQRKMLWFETPVCFVYHIMNAFESGDNVVVDVIKNSMNFDMEFFNRKNKPPELVRWTLNRITGQLMESQLSEYPVEFPRLNDQFIGREYRYGYTVTVTSDMKFGPAYKHDMLTGTTLIHNFGPGRVAMEPVFVPNLAGEAEDSGWLMFYVFDENINKTDIVILDAQDFEGAPVAIIHLPVRVPFGFHGNWVQNVA